MARPRPNSQAARLHADLEREYLAARLHDGLCQLLTGSSMLLQSVRQAADPAQWKLLSADLAVQLDAALRETCDLVRGLRGGEGLGATAPSGTRPACDVTGSPSAVPEALRARLLSAAEVAVWHAVAARGAGRVAVAWGPFPALLECLDDGSGFPDFPDVGLQLLQSHATLLEADLRLGRAADGRNRLALSARLPAEDEGA